MKFIRWLLIVAWLLPYFAHAGDAEDFATASRTQQAKLLQSWAATPDASRLPLLSALTQENLVTDEQHHAFVQNASTLLPLGEAKTPVGEVKKFA